MKNRTMILTLASVAVLALVAVSFAGPGRGFGHGYYGRGPGMMGGYGYTMMGNAGFGPGANLSDEQRTALEKTAQDFAAKTQSQRADLYAKNLELQAELAKSAPDQARVSTLAKEVNTLQGKLFEAQTAFRATLAKDYGIRGGFGPGMGGYHMGQRFGMAGNGFGPGACPFRGDADDNDRAN